MACRPVNNPSLDDEIGPVAQGADTIEGYMAQSLSSSMSYGGGGYYADRSHMSESRVLQKKIIDVYGNGDYFGILFDDTQLLVWGGKYSGDFYEPDYSNEDSSKGVSSVAFIPSYQNVAKYSGGLAPFIFSRNEAMVVRKDDGSVVYAGPRRLEFGNYDAVKNLLNSGVTKVVSAGNAFFAFKDDGSVIPWGKTFLGWDYARHQIGHEFASGVEQIFANGRAFAMIKTGGRVVTWGNPNRGGKVFDVEVASQLSSGVKTIVPSIHAFAAIKEDGSVVAWGHWRSGGEIPSDLKSQLSSGVTDIVPTLGAFAALKEDGRDHHSVITWGGVSFKPAEENYGGDSSAVASSLSGGVTKVYATKVSYAALTNQGEVVTWGKSHVDPHNSHHRELRQEISSGVKEIFTTTGLYAALKEDNSLIIWGDAEENNFYWWKPNRASFYKFEDVKTVVANKWSFAILKNDDTVASVGVPRYGGRNHTIANVDRVIANNGGFLAIRKDNSLQAWGSKVVARLPKFLRDSVPGSVPAPTPAPSLRNGCPENSTNVYANVCRCDFNATEVLFEKGDQSGSRCNRPAPNSCAPNSYEIGWGDTCRCDGDRSVTFKKGEDPPTPCFPFFCPPGSRNTYNRSTGYNDSCVCNNDRSIVFNMEYQSSHPCP